MSADSNRSQSAGGGPLMTIIVGIVVVVVAIVLVKWVSVSEVPAEPVAETAPATPAPAAPAVVAAKADAKPAAASEELAALPLELPNPVFAGTPSDIPPGARMLPPTGKSREPFLAPKGLTNVAQGKPVTASDSNPIIGSLDLVTDGDKEALDGRWVELGPGIQWVQIDLGAPMEIYAILLWHHHAEPVVYRDVVIQLSDDPDFLTGVKTVFNNDHDNSAGQGAGEEYEFFEDYEGRLIDTKGAVGRYIRWYSNGSTGDDMNRYTEIEAWGRPAKK